MRRPGSFPGGGDVADSSALGVNMAEYVLGASPHASRLHTVNHRFVSASHRYSYLLNVDWGTETVRPEKWDSLSLVLHRKKLTVAWVNSSLYFVLLIVVV